MIYVLTQNFINNLMGLKTKKPPKCASLSGIGGVFLKIVIKAKDSPWDAVLMGSVASTVDTKITPFCGITNNSAIFFIKTNDRFLKYAINTFENMCLLNWSICLD